MSKADLEKSCQEDLKILLDKKVVDVNFKAYDETCWRIHINTDKGDVVMTFCRDWACPIVEYRKP